MSEKNSDTASGSKGMYPTFVYDDKWYSGEPVQFVGEPAVCFRFGEAGDPLCGASERDSVAAAGCLDSEGDGEVCFAGSGRAQEDRVVGFSDEVELVEVGDLGS